jgi:hypothetical protein
MDIPLEGHVDNREVDRQSSDRWVRGSLDKSTLDRFITVAASSGRQHFDFNQTLAYHKFLWNSLFPVHFFNI